MQKVTILCVGKLKEKFYLDASGEYLKRLQRHCKCEVVELPEVRLGDNPSQGEIDRALKEEGDNIRRKLPKGGAVVAMCIEGELLSSVALSETLQQYGNEGKTSVTFLIGGSFGLDQDLKREADRRISMSPMTFPHHLARIMLLEQVYRAYQIADGTKYHK